MQVNSPADSLQERQSVESRDFNSVCLLTEPLHSREHRRSIEPSVQFPFSLLIEAPDRCCPLHDSRTVCTVQKECCETEFEAISSSTGTVYDLFEAPPLI